MSTRVSHCMCHLCIPVSQLNVCVHVCVARGNGMAGGEFSLFVSCCSVLSCSIEGVYLACWHQCCECVRGHDRFPTSTYTFFFPFRNIPHVVDSSNTTHIYLLSRRRAHSLHTSTQAAPNHKSTWRKAGINFCISTLFSPLHSVPSYIIVAVETCHTDKYKGLGSYCRAVHVKPFLNEHTLVVILPWQPGRRQPCESFPTVHRRPVVQTACMIELSWTNILQTSPLTPSQAIAKSLWKKWKCWGVWYQLDINPSGVKYFRPVVNLLHTLL